MQKMKIELKHIVMMLCTGFLLALVGCTEDSADGTTEQRTHNLRLSLGSRQYDFDMTRSAGDLPANFMDYETYRKRSDIQLPPFSQIQCYLTTVNTDEDPISCTFTYQEIDNPNVANDKDDIWTTRVPLKEKDVNGNPMNYYFYGYLPKGGVGGTVAINRLGTNDGYEKGAILTLNGLNAVTPEDICIIVGAQGYAANATVPDMSTRLGKFSFQPSATTTDDNIFLLIDHLYAGLQFYMQLDSKYAALRKIKVTHIELTPGDGNNEVYETVDATVKIVANESQINPIVEHLNSAGVNISGDVTFTTHLGTNPVPAVLYGGREDEEGKYLTTESMPFQACFCPSTNRKFTLETTYDVYDRKDNLIRERQKARNTISLEYNLNAGQIHTLNITVKPTFLYMLSEPDLDNPTFDVN